MLENDARDWASLVNFDPKDGTIVREPERGAPGYWAGAPSVTFCEKLGRFYLVYRKRRPRGVHPDRGAEVCIASSHDGIVFEDVWSGTKDLLDTTSIERCALINDPQAGWRLYVSYVDAVDRRWQIGVVEAEAPDAFDLSATKPILTPADIGAEGVKDPFIFRVAGMYQMVVSHAHLATSATPDDLHGTHDVYNTGLILSASGLATSLDGLAWEWEGEILTPNRGAWDGYASRIGTLWYQSPVWLAMYDGSADVSENYEERCGLAYSFNLRDFHRVSREGPLFQTPENARSVRYFDVVYLSSVMYFYYEMARPDGSHDLRVYRSGPGDNV